LLLKGGAVFAIEILGPQPTHFFDFPQLHLVFVHGVCVGRALWTVRARGNTTRVPHVRKENPRHTAFYTAECGWCDILSWRATLCVKRPFHALG
jgi:hypothetical protein